MTTMTKSEMPWWYHGSCRGMDVNIFFEPRADEMRYIKRICDGCPVVAECLLDATNPDGPVPQYGVRAGLSPAQQHGIRERRAKSSANRTRRRR